MPDRHFAFGAWQNGEDEALVIEFTPPQCEQWIFQLCNIWHENLDNYEEGQGYLNKFTATPDSDGLVRWVRALFPNAGSLLDRAAMVVQSRAR